MNTEKLNIDIKGDTLRIGADFHTLEDHTKSTFKTSELGEFVKFMEGEPTPAVILCRPTQVTASPAETDRYSIALAECDLQLSPPMARLMAMESANVSLSDFTEFLESFKRYGDAKVLDLLASVRHFKLKKLVSVESSKETNGDYSFRVGLESGNDDFQPPANLGFSVPVFKHMDEQITLNFELLFKVPSAAPPRLEFVIQNFALEDEVLARQREIITAKIASLKPKKLWGLNQVIVRDDSWKYLPNPEQSGAGAGLPKNGAPALDAYRTNQR